MGTFKDFLNEEKMVTIDADSATAANDLKRAQRTDATRLANQKVNDAQERNKNAQANTTANDPVARLRKTREAKAAELALLDKRIAQMAKRK